MNSEFVHWDDLDLDYFLGEKNWTDGEEDDVIWGTENEWGSGDDNKDVPARHVETMAMDKENVPKKKQSKTSDNSTILGFMVPAINHLHFFSMKIDYIWRHNSGILHEPNN